MYIDVDRLELIEDTSDVTYRLHISRVDEELLNLLLLTDKKFELVYDINKFNEDELSVLCEYEKKCNRRVMLGYDIENKTLFDRTLLIYYMNLFNLNVLLVSSKIKDVNEWKKGIRTYSKNKIKVLKKVSLHN